MKTFKRLAPSVKGHNTFDSNKFVAIKKSEDELVQIPKEFKEGNAATFKVNMKTRIFRIFHESPLALKGGVL